MYIDVLIPPPFTIPNAANSLIITTGGDGISELALIKSPYQDKSFNEQLIVQNFMQGVYSVLSHSPRFTKDKLHIASTRQSKGMLTSRQLNWDLIDSLIKDREADMVVAMEYCRMIDSFDLYYNADIYGYTARYVIHYYTVWRMYYPAEHKILDEYIIRDSLIWTASAGDAYNAVRELPLAGYAATEAAYEAGVTYGLRIAPYWKEEVRRIHTPGHIDMQIAKRWAKKGQWKKAMEIWAFHANNPQSRLQTMATYNMAVAYETLDMLDEALLWAKKAYDMEKTNRHKNYVEQIQQRMEIKETLEKQMNIR